MHGNKELKEEIEILKTTVEYLKEDIKNITKDLNLIIENTKDNLVKKSAKENSNNSYKKAIMNNDLTFTNVKTTSKIFYTKENINSLQNRIENTTQEYIEVYPCDIVTCDAARTFLYPKVTKYPPISIRKNSILELENINYYKN